MKKTNKWKQVVSVLAAATMLVGCGSSSGSKSGSSSSKSDTMVVGYSQFNQKFSPFFATTSYDQDAMNLTQVNLLTLDRMGQVITKGIKGEKTKYNGKNYKYTGPADLKVKQNDDGTVDYDFKLRDDIKFSDGKKLTADDVIFSMYVLSDPTYDGSSTFFSLPIEGMEEYRSGMDTLFNLLMTAGKDNTDFSKFDEATAKKFWDTDFPAAAEKYVKSIQDQLVASGSNKDGDSVAACAANWGYTLPDGATAVDFVNAILANPKYKSATEALTTEKGDAAFVDCLPESYKEGVATGDAVDNIKGIVKKSDTEVTVHMTKVDATAIYNLGVAIAPMHYYGETSKYNYDKNEFGFKKGDLSHVRSVTTKPLGAGPYVFKAYKNGRVTYDSNSTYYKAAPKIKHLTLQESQEADLLNGVTTGTVDVAQPSITTDVAKAIKQQNSNGKLSGNKIVTKLHDFLGYGYIGMDADLVKVGDDASSDASKDLRKAFATIFSVYRDVAIDSYYGDTATVINYPISNTSWAAPQPTDDGYSVAFSKDVTGKDIYTEGMKADDKYAAAKTAALGFLQAAGYTVADGKVTAAPKGAKTDYSVTIPGGGSGDHPSFMILDEAKKALADIGIKLTVNDLSDSSQLWDGLDANQIEMWCAAWGATPDPDMYQVYYSDVANGGANPGGSNYMNDLKDSKLDDLILQARSTTDQDARKQMYKACLDIIVDWAVEVPVYQRQECTIFSAKRVNIKTITPDITPFYNWMSEIENTELN
jgi:peptide/nickel transport system substrate-binding protein